MFEKFGEVIGVLKSAFMIAVEVTEVFKDVFIVQVTV